MGRYGGPAADTTQPYTGSTVTVGVIATALAVAVFAGVTVGIARATRPRLVVPGGPERVGGGFVLAVSSRGFRPLDAVARVEEAADAAGPSAAADAGLPVTLYWRDVAGSPRLSGGLVEKVWLLTLQARDAARRLVVVRWPSSPGGGACAEIPAGGTLWFRLTIGGNAYSRWFAARVGPDLDVTVTAGEPPHLNPVRNTVVAIDHNGKTRGKRDAARRVR